MGMCIYMPIDKNIHLDMNAKYACICKSEENNKAYLHSLLPLTLFSV